MWIHAVIQLWKRMPYGKHFHLIIWKSEYRENGVKKGVGRAKKGAFLRGRMFREDSQRPQPPHLRLAQQKSIFLPRLVDHFHSARPLYPVNSEGLCLLDTNDGEACGFATIHVEGGLSVILVFEGEFFKFALAPGVGGFEVNDVSGVRIIEVSFAFADEAGFAISPEFGGFGFVVD